MKDFAPETEPYQEWIGGLYQRGETEAPVHDRLYRQGVERVARTLQAPPPRVDPETEDLRECVFRPALSDRTAQLANHHNQSRQDVVSRLTRKDDGARSRRGSVAGPNGALPEQQYQQYQQPAGSDRQAARSGPNVWDRLGAAPIRNFREPPYAERNEATFRPQQPQAQPQQQQPQHVVQPQRRNVFDRLYQQSTESAARRRSESCGSRGSRGKAAALASADVEVEVLDSGVFDEQAQSHHQAYPQQLHQQHAYAHEFSEPAVDEYADNVIVIGESSATAVVSQPQPMQQQHQQLQQQQLQHQHEQQQQQKQYSQHLQQQQHYPQHHQPQDTYDRPPYGHDNHHQPQQQQQQQQQQHSYTVHPPAHHTPDDIAPLSPLSEDTLAETVPSQGQAYVPVHPSHDHHPLQRQPLHPHDDAAATATAPVVASQQHRAASSSSLPPPPPPASAYAAIAAGDLAGFQRAHDGGGATLLEGERELSFLAAAVLADAPAIAGFLCSSGVLSVAAPAVASSPYRAAAGDGDECEGNPRHVLFRCPHSGRNALHLAAVHKRAACVRAIAAALPGTTAAAAAGTRSGSAASVSAAASGGAAQPSAFADLLCSRDATGLTPLMLAAGASRDGLFLPSVERHLPPAGADGTGHGYAGVSVRCADGPLLGRMEEGVDAAAARVPPRHLLFSWRNSFELSVAGAGSGSFFRCSVDVKALSRAGVKEVIAFLEGYAAAAGDGCGGGVVDATGQVYPESSGWWGSSVDPEASDVLRALLPAGCAGAEAAVLEGDAEAGRTAVHHAAAAGWADRVLTLRAALPHGFASVPADGRGRTLLHAACGGHAAAGRGQHHPSAAVVALLAAEAPHVNAWSGGEAAAATPYGLLKAYADCTGDAAPLRALLAGTDADATTAKPSSGEGGGGGDGGFATAAWWWLRAAVHTVFCAAPALLAAALSARDAYLSVVLTQYFRGVGVERLRGGGGGGGGGGDDDDAAEKANKKKDEGEEEGVGRGSRRRLLLSFAAAAVAYAAVASLAAGLASGGAAAAGPVVPLLAVLLCAPLGAHALQLAHRANRVYALRPQHTSPFLAKHLSPPAAFATVCVLARALFVHALVGLGPPGADGADGGLWTRAPARVLLTLAAPDAAFAVAVAASLLLLGLCGGLQYAAYCRPSVLPAGGGGGVRDRPLTMVQLVCRPQPVEGAKEGVQGAGTTGTTPPDWFFDEGRWARRVGFFCGHGAFPFVVFGLLRPALILFDEADEGSAGTAGGRFQVVWGVVSAFLLLSVAVPYVVRMGAPLLPPVLVFADAFQAALLTLARFCGSDEAFHATAMVACAASAFVWHRFSVCDLGAAASDGAADPAPRRLVLPHKLFVAPHLTACALASALLIYSAGGRSESVATAATVCPSALPSPFHCT